MFGLYKFYSSSIGGGTRKQMKAGVVGVLCFVVGVLVTPLCIWGYLSFGRPPVTVADPAFPFEKQIVRVPLHLRMESETEQAAIQPSEDNFLAGAQIYKKDCSFCHGTPSQPAAVGSNMYPSVPQLWQKHKNGVVGVSDDPVGVTYWRVKNGIRLTGMPSYQKMLSPTQMWQVSLLLASADKPLSSSVQAALSQP